MKGAVKLVAVLCAVVAAAGCGDSEPARDPSGESFAVVSVAGTDGASPSIAGLEDIRLDFSDTGDWVEWTAGCNMFSAAAKIGRSRMKLDRYSATEVACESGMDAEDWFAEFMGEDPEWRFDGSMLTLSTDRAVVELEPAGHSE